MSVAFTVFAGPLMQFSRAAAYDMYERTPYLEAVLGEERVEGVRDELTEFTEDLLVDIDTGDRGVRDNAPVRTSLEPEDTANLEDTRHSTSSEDEAAGADSAEGGDQ